MNERAPKSQVRKPKIRLVGSRCEWIGGRLSPPFFVNDHNAPCRPTLVLWMEQPSGLLVGHEVITPENAEGAVGRALRAALEHPLAGPPRRPDALRVSDAATANEVRAAIGDSIPVTVAPTPELDAVLHLMLKEMPGSGIDVSYLQGGRIPPAAIEQLFSAAEVLYRLAPWKVATNGQVLRMDIPALGVEGACVSIIGSLGENRGVLVFPSLAGYEAFVRAAQRPRSRGRPDAGTDWLSLSFDRGADLSTTQRREVAAHGWRVADANAYPVVTRHDRDGASRPLVERDVKIATACATSLTAFFLKHRNLFAADQFEPVCESWLDAYGLEVRFTIPYEAFELFEIGSNPVRAAARPARPRRNDPCYCGSGRKYKQCHLPLDERDDGRGRYTEALASREDAVPTRRPRATPRREGEAFGICAQCGARASSEKMAEHLRVCPGSRGKVGRTEKVQLRVESVDRPEFWMDLEIDTGATLSKLDDFLRDIWLECCGHLSAFRIGRYVYSSTGPTDPPLSTNERAMSKSMHEVLPPAGTEFHYEYDFGSTTRLVLRAWGSRQGAREAKRVRLLARNEARTWRCVECRETAAVVCPFCRDTGDGTLCAMHAKEHDCTRGEADMLLPIVNSPRMGVCGYARET